MTKYRKQTHNIHTFILSNVDKHPKDITTLTADKFGISRTAVLRHINTLIDKGLLNAIGKTKDRHYALKSIVEKDFNFKITPDISEDKIWRENIHPLLNNATSNALTICQYAFTEMMNNVIDHSGANTVSVYVEYTPATIIIIVDDNGFGIFHKIMSDFHLNDERHAILELSKGKLTTDPDRHTGEGIFFTSRAVDRFSIFSGSLIFTHCNSGDVWLLEVSHSSQKQGTTVSFSINPNTKRQLQDVFDTFATENDYGFSRTIVPVVLAKYDDENLISRSQAKRLLTRFERFKEIVLDFNNITLIGQAFADEIFRVYKNKHPEVHITPVNANEQILKMISRTTKQLHDK